MSEVLMSSNNFCCDIAITEAHCCLICGQQSLSPDNYWNVFDGMSECSTTLSTFLTNILVGFNDCEHFAHSKVICTSCRKLIDFAEELKSQLHHVYKNIQSMYNSTKLQKQAWKGCNKNKVDTIASMDQGSSDMTGKHSNRNGDDSTIVKKQLDLRISKDVALPARQLPSLISTMFDESTSEHKRKRCLLLDDVSPNTTKVLTIDLNNSSEENVNPGDIYDLKPKKVKYSPKKSSCLPNNLQDTRTCQFQEKFQYAPVSELDHNVTNNIINVCVKNETDKCLANKTTEINIKYNSHKRTSNRAGKKLLEADYESCASKKCKADKMEKEKQIGQSFDESHVETVCHGMKNMFTTINSKTDHIAQEAVLYCDICEDEFNDTEQLRDHIELHYTPFY